MMMMRMTMAMIIMAYSQYIYRSLSQCQPENLLFVIGFCLKNYSSPRPFCSLHAQSENLRVTIFSEQELLIW